MSKVSVKFGVDGKAVVPYANNNEYGYVVLESSQAVFQNGWIREKTRSTLIRGTVSILSTMFATKSELPGQIVVTECTEDAIPAKFASQFDKKLTFEEQIAPYIKRAGDGGPVLISNGRRILRFTEYDQSGTLVDARVAHDNVNEVRAFSETQRAAAAKK